MIEFVKEVEIIDKISSNQLYEKYKYWCDDSGHNPMARNTFLKRVAKAFKEYRPELVSYRTSKYRGWQPKFMALLDDETANFD
jgi:phage/plasmid-associated DNA primase